MKLGRAPTLLYLFGYLITIFVFSLIYYYALPGKHLYHATSQFEDEFFNSDANDILEGLRSEMIKTFLENGEAQQEINGWKLDINELGLYSLSAGNFPAEFSFQARIPITHSTQGQDDLWASIPAKIIVFPDERIRIDNTIYLVFTIESNENFLLEGIPSSEILFPYRSFEQQKNATLFPMSVDLYNKMIGFGQGYRGFPSNVSGQYWRMLYFSIGIATSSAFGDIVPISTQARIIVLLEALFAVVFVGLFLNSLVYDVGEAIKLNGKDKIDTIADKNEKRLKKRVPDVGDSTRLRASSTPKKNPPSKPSLRSARPRVTQTVSLTKGNWSDNNESIDTR